MTRRRTGATPLVVLFFLLITACSSGDRGSSGSSGSSSRGQVAASGSNAIAELRRELDVYPEYSVILQDMRERGNFVKEYDHQYKVITGERSLAAGSRPPADGGPQSGDDAAGPPGGNAGEQPPEGTTAESTEGTEAAQPGESALGQPAAVADVSQGTADLIYRDEIRDWQPVDRKTYEKYRSHLGMVILSKGPEGKVEEAQHPPGYQYVGNTDYGRWRTDNRGGSFWEFYGKYALLTHALGMFNRPIYRNDWDSYRDSRSRGAAYFGPNREYGTQGRYTQRTNPSFYQRQQTKQRASQQRFSQRVQNRVSRSSGARGRSGGFGK